HFVYEGETLQEALAPGSARRRALDAALAELEAGHKQPSIEWRRQFSLLLGLERLLSEEEPHLADGTVLSAHQVDALSGTLTALLAEAQRSANGNGAGSVIPEHVVAEPRVDGGFADQDGSNDDRELDLDLDDEAAADADEDEDEDDDEEPQDWQDEDEDDQERFV